MSRYEHESGTIVIPTKAWPKFRKAIIEAWNERQDKLYQIAQRLRKELPAKLKGKESWEWDDAFADAVATICSHDDRYIGSIPDDISFKLKKFIKGGNQYEAAIKNLGQKSVTIFIRETHRSARFKNTPTFPANS